MSTDYNYELRMASQEMRSKYTYFILTAVGACIGFAVTQTRGEHLSLVHAPLGLALLFWGLTFYCGCRFLNKAAVAGDVNALAVWVLSGKHPVSGDDPAKIKIGYDAAQNDYAKTQRKAGLAFRWQLRFFLLGAAFFIIWHILGMWSAGPRIFTTYI
ncbi:hypothetical protein [Achromobacter kerstersii]|uniref:hypothetical protein n=1 Tax=Achromobacter kerstersii TaxID=1353890 RepID=UPI0006C38D39|nr:hypothetical protein [Achromobacter kerstersii]CUJ49122.1 Uncharacterised protein [Achromobacter kerstersii]